MQLLKTTNNTDLKWAATAFIGILTDFRKCRVLNLMIVWCIWRAESSTGMWNTWFSQTSVLHHNTTHNWLEPEWKQLASWRVWTWRLNYPTLLHDKLKGDLGLSWFYCWCRIKEIYISVIHFGVFVIGFGDYSPGFHIKVIKPLFDEIRRYILLRDAHMVIFKTLFLLIVHESVCLLKSFAWLLVEFYLY